MEIKPSQQRSALHTPLTEAEIAGKKERVGAVATVPQRTDGIERKSGTLAMPSAEVEGALALPPRGPLDNLFVSHELAPEWRAVEDLDPSLRNAAFVELPARTGSSRTVTLEALSTWAAMEPETALRELQPVFRFHKDRLEVDVYAFVREAAPERLRELTPKEFAQETVQAESRLEPRTQRGTELTATMQQNQSSDFHGGDGRQQHPRDDTPQTSTAEEESDQPVYGIREADAFELLPDPIRGLEASFATWSQSSPESVRQAALSTVESEPSETVFISAHHSVSVPEVNELLQNVKTQATSIGAESLAATADHTLEAISAIQSTEQFLELMRSESVGIEQLLMMVMLHVSEQSDEQIRNAMEDIVIAEQNEAQRNALEGIADVSSLALGEGVDLAVSEIQALDSKLEGETPSQTVLMQELQYLTHQWQQINELVSNMSKSLHDMAMTPIRNLR